MLLTCLLLSVFELWNLLLNVCFFIIVLNNFNLILIIHYFVVDAGAPEAQANRDYIVRKMSDEVQEIIRVLQLTTYDEDEWDADDITVMKKSVVSFRKIGIP